MDPRWARKHIERCFPEIRVRRARQILTGWENLVLEINGEYIFRFPKFKDTEKRLKSEIELLQNLRSLLSTPVPDYKFVWKGERNYPRFFGGYPKLRGATISDRIFDSESTRKLAEEISGFLKELHALKISAKTLKVPVYTKEEWLESTRLHYNKVRRIVHPLLTPALRARSEKFWEDLLADFAEADFWPALIHGDLGTDNILFDPATSELTGILDWGYTQVGDVALELAHLFINNPRIGQEILSLYGSVGSSFEERVRWYVKSEPFYDVMWGLAHHWAKAKREGLRHLDGLLRE